MVAVQVATLAGTNTVLPEATVDEFKEGLRGQLILPDDCGYDDARAIFNSMIDKHPALIARCAGVSDVINSVKFARAHDLLAAVRGGGHSFPGNSVCDDGLVIDLSLMKSVRVDPKKRTVRAEGGVKWWELDQETQAFGLATTGGTVSTTGIAGLTLGGGVGWIARKHGLSVDNLLSADVVTADGRLLVASATENDDLFWGLRGGSGNFGVVTSFEYQLHPVGPVVLAGPLVYPLEKAKEVLRFYQEFISDVPDELMTTAGFANSPEGEPAVVIIVCYTGPIDEGEKLLEPLRELDSPLEDQVCPMAYTKVQTMLDQDAPWGIRNYIKTSFMKAIDDDAAQMLADRFKRAPSRYTVVTLFQLGGAVSRVDKQDTAFYHRDAGYHAFLSTAWEDAADDERNIRWMRDTWSAMQRFASGGVYVNEMGDEQESIERVKEAYGPTTYQRLVSLKNKYDPTNFFRLNPNIKPTV